MQSSKQLSLETPLEPREQVLLLQISSWTKVPNQNQWSSEERGCREQKYAIFVLEEEENRRKRQA